MQNKSSKVENKKWLSILIAFVVSIGLWLYVVTVENPTKDLIVDNIPVRFVNVDILRENGLIISDTDVADGVKLKFVGRLSDLNKLKQNKSDIEVVIDVAHFTRAEEYKISYGLDNVILPSLVSSGDFVLEMQSPYDIKIQTSELASKKISVVLDDQISTKDNYIVGESKLNYTEVNIEGPVDEIDQISHAQATLERKNVDRTINTELPLSIINKSGDVVDLEEAAITLDVSNIEVKVPIMKRSVVKLEPVFEFSDCVTESDITVSVEPAEITIAGDASVLDGISSIKLDTIKTSGLMSNEEVVVLEIPLPEGCEIVNDGADTADEEGPMTATVSITIANKEITTIKVPSKEFVYKVNDGLPVTFVTKELNVTVRAKPEDINRITVDDIKVFVDLNKAEIKGNTRTVNATVTLEGFEGAGVLADREDKYQVTLTVAPGN